MDDRRRHQRYGTRSERKFIVQYEKENKIAGEVKDFSRSGLSFDSKDDLRREREVKLLLQISGKEQNVPASVKIVWSRNNPEGYTYGAKFTSIVADDKFDIMDLLYQDWKKTLSSRSLLN